MQDSFIESLESRGLTRRAFLGFCGTIAAAIGIEGVTAADVAEAIESNSLIGTDGGLGEGGLAPVIWMELGSCTGCTESFAQADKPDPATLILEYLALNYAETLSAAAGYSLEEAREETIEAAKGLDEDEQEKKSGKYIRRERYAGACERSFYVGENVTEADIKGEFKHGILKLLVPKKDKPAVEEKKYIAIEG